ncbi:hypothetical protein AVEN_24571-1 [Araneus ventricosus]|uniref:Uncharacterized protein n=1 Tax=Araneus ventricosus TaxID=182803 RepID=A0A4Y2FAF3_ARAVE|nr:hypothetical protein AVEN_24571-1 [Araneus ventricosus]
MSSTVLPPLRGCCGVRGTWTCGTVRATWCHGPGLVVGPGGHETTAIHGGTKKFPWRTWRGSVLSSLTWREHNEMIRSEGGSQTEGNY